MALNSKQIADLNALNQKISTGYAPSTADTANLNYAKQQGYNYTPMAAGAVKIANEAGLKGLSESQIYRSGQDIYKLPTSMTSDVLTNPNTATIKPVVVDPLNPDTLMAGVKTGNEGVLAQLKARDAQLQEQTKVTELQKRQADYTETQKTAQRDLQEQKWNQNGLNANVAEVQKIMPQIASTTAQFDTLQEQNKNLPIANRIIGGTQDRLLRQKAIEVAGLSAVAQAYQGNVDMARNLAQDAINAQYQDQTNYFDSLNEQLRNSYTDLTNAEQKRADKLMIVNDERLRNIETEKEVKTNINNLAITAAQNGANSDVVKKILSSKTEGEAIINSGQYIKAPVGSTTTWDTFTDTATGETKLVNRFTGDVKNIGQANTNIGNPVGEVMGLPSYNTRAENPGVTRSDRNNNPGNIKVSANTKNWAGVIGVESNLAEDGGNFLIFDTPESGINAIGRLLQTDGYSGMSAEKAIKRYNGGGAYGASTVGLDPNQDSQSQISDPVKLKEVATRIAQAEGFKGNKGVSLDIGGEVASLVELVKTGRLSDTEALTKVSKPNLQKLTEELAKVEITPVISEYNQERALRTLQSVDELLPKISQYTVGWGVLSKGVPTSPARNFAAQLDTLKSAIAFGELTAMREASKTGGALGQVSDKEGKLLESALGALDQGQSPEEFKKQLEKIKTSINNWYGAVDGFKNENNISNTNLSDLNFKF